MKAGKAMSVCQLLILASDFLVLPIVHKSSITCPDGRKEAKVNAVWGHGT